MTVDPSLVLMSFLIGILVGLTSMGGAALMTPVLILFMGVRPLLAVGTDLMYSSVTKMAGAWMHWRQKTVDFGVCFRMASTSVPCGLAGVLTIEYLRKHGWDIDRSIKQSMGIALLVVAAIVLARTMGLNPAPRFGEFVSRHQRVLTYIWGGFVGFGVGLTSVGSGSLIAPFLMVVFASNPSKAVGTDVMHACVLVSATGLLHWNQGHVDWNLVPVLLMGSIPGVLLGSWLAPRLPARALRAGLGVLLLATGWKMV